MSENKNPSNESSTQDPPSVTYFIEKLATVLSRVKDCILQDILDEFIKEGASWEDFQKELQQAQQNSLSENLKDFKVFVDKIVKKLGYDIEAAETECGELYEVLEQLVVSGEKLGVAVKKLFKEYEDKDPQEVVEKLISGFNLKVNEDKAGENSTLVTLSDVKNSFSSLGNLCDEAKKLGDSDTILIGTDKFNISLAAEGDYGKIVPILNIIQELLDLIKKFSDIEWGKIKDELKGVGDFIYDSCFTEEFGKRILDYILILVLKNAKDVFKEDLNALLDGLKKCKDEAGRALKETLNDPKYGFVKDAVDFFAKFSNKKDGDVILDLLDKILGLKDEIDNLKSKVATELQDALNKAKDEIDAAQKAIGDEVKELAETAEKSPTGAVEGAEGALENLGETAGDSVSKIGGIAEDAVSNIADKLEETGSQIKDNIEQKIKEAQDRIKKEIEDRIKEEVSRRVQAAIKVAEEEINKLVKEAFPQYDSLARIFHKVYAVLEFTGIIGKEKVKLETYIPKQVDDNDGGVLDPIKSIEIPAFHWEFLTKIFTNPKEYLDENFPLNNCDDVENLIVKVSDLLGAFGCDIPKISSIKDFLWELVARVEAEIKKSTAPELKEFVEKLKAFKAYLYTALITLEEIVAETKNQLMSAFEQGANDAESLVKKLETRAIAELNALDNDARNAIGAFAEELNFASIDKDHPLYKIFVETLGDAAYEEISTSFKDVKLSKPGILEKCKKSANDSAKKLSKEVNDLVTKINTFLDPNEWEKSFNDTVKKLKTEFEAQTAGIPKNKKDVEKAVVDSIDDLLSGNTPKNPFDGIDFSKYYDIVANAIEERLPKDLDKEFEDVGNALNEAINGLTEAICRDAENLKDNADQNVDEIVKYSEGFPQLACNILNTWLEKVKEKFYEIIIKPIISQVRKAVKAWFNEILSVVLKEVKKSLADLLKDPKIKDFVDTLEKIFGDANKAIEKITNTISEIQGIVDEAKGLIDDAKKVDTWKSGFLFAVKVINAIPEDVRNMLLEACNFPKLPKCLENISLPDYKFDAANRLLIVNLWTKETAGGRKNASGTAEICLQLALFVGEKDVGGSKHDGLYIVPIVTGSFGAKIDVGKNHIFEFGGEASLNKDSGPEKEKLDGTTSIFIDVDESIGNNPVSVTGNKESVSAKASLKFGRKEGADELSFFDTDIASLSIKNYSVGTSVYYNKENSGKGFDFEVNGLLDTLVLTLKLRNQNDFFKKILSDDIAIKLSKLDVGYSLNKGFNIDGGLYVKIPINSDIDLKFVKFNNIGLEIGGEKGNLIANLLTTFVVDLEGVVITFPEMGLGIKCNVLDSDFKPGSFKISPKFKFPSGLGISIDVEAVKGSGFVDWNEEKGRFFGQVELTILDKCGASGRILFTTGKNNSPYSFSGALSVFFTPGIQLGMGFSLTAIGGSLGVNRGLNIDKLRDAVYDGTLTSVLLTKNIDKDIEKILANIDSYYPIHEGQMYFGLLGQITWGEILKADLGLFIQAPSPVAIIIAGNVGVKIENESAKKLIAINASFMGGYQADKGIFFDAHLYDSHIVGIDLYGDVAMRIYWAGSTKGFILSAGGFHPQYKPESGFNLPEMKRMGMKLDYDILKMSLEAYFAITSNTVQFGTDLQMKIGWDKFGISGYAGFNALFQFHPFKFVVDMSAGLAVKVGSCTICSISLYFELGGPAQWHAKGTASFWILFIEVKVSFNLTWGKKQVEDNRSRIDVLPLYTNAFNDRNNWRFISSDLVDNMVTLVKFDKNEFVLQPSESIMFNQSAVPFYKKMECYGEDVVNDYNCLTIKDILIGDTSIKNYKLEEEYFAPSLIKKLSEKEKLSSKSYEKMLSGFQIQTDLGATNVKPIEQYCNYDEQVYTNGCSEKEWNAYVNKCKGNGDKMENNVSGGQTGSKRLSQSKLSSRRSRTGFERSVKQMDQALTKSSKISQLINKL